MIVAPEDHRSQGARRRLVEELKGKGIADPRVLDAIGTVPRHQFIDDTALHLHAYEDKAFPIGWGQTISQPYTVAYQSALLDLSPGMKVLEIGTGSGYQTAVLARMGAKVWSIERQRPLYLRTKERLGAMGVKANLYYGDGYLGLPVHGPFDRILVTCGATHIPPALLDQLRAGGRMVIPVNEGEDQRMLHVTRDASGTVVVSEHGRFRFVPMLSDKASGS